MRKEDGEIMEEQLRRGALISSRSTLEDFCNASQEPLRSARDLALAYSPGVAYALSRHQDDPNEAATLTSRANLGRYH
jgi:malate dehydrogenase (oxaloacetate-decarboxylating)(NADP+)